MNTAVARGTTARLANATVREAMHEGVIKCPLDTPLEEVARRMASRRVHAIVAVEDAPVWSVVSDLDLVSLAAVGSAQDTAGDAATTEAVTIGPDETLDRAAQRVREHAIAHLLVAR